MYLNIQIPAGEIFMKPSGICGTSIAKLSSPVPEARHLIQTRADQNGNLIRTISLAYTELQTRQSAFVDQSGSAFAEQIVTFESYAEKGEYKSVFHPDPFMPTDMVLNLGVGRSRLDLSGMTLTNLSVNSMFSDVTITYTAPNKVEMKQMDIHAARAKVSVKNIEFARAELVSIRNDMGDTRVIIGSDYQSHGTIFIQSAMGGCTLVIDEAQPAKIILKSGIFTNKDISGAFSEIGDNIYANEAFLKGHDQFFTIICNVDMGRIAILDNR
jgi:hypothetical protein